MIALVKRSWKKAKAAPVAKKTPTAKKVPRLIVKRARRPQEEPPNQQGRESAVAISAEASTSDPRADEDRRVEEEPDVRLDELPEQELEQQGNEGREQRQERPQQAFLTKTP